MELLAKAAREGRPVDVAELMAAVPYCEFLGLKASLRGEEVVIEMPFDAKLVGNPIIPALHGGVIGSLLETAAIAQAIWSTRAVKITSSRQATELAPVRSRLNAAAYPCNAAVRAS